MKSTSEILASFLKGVRYLTGATTATIYVAPRPEGEVEPILLVEGEEAPIVEFDEPLEGRRRVAGLDVALEDDTFAVPSATADTWLVPLGDESPSAETAREFAGPKRRRVDRTARRQILGWLGLRYDGAPGELGLPPDTRTDLPPLWEWISEFGGNLASQAMRLRSTLRDPVTGLADRIAFQAYLSDHVEQARAGEHWLSLVLINPHNFGQINERFGHRAGDRVIRELADLISRSLRDTDPVSRYGGAIFGALLPGTTLQEAEQVARKLVETVRTTTFLEGEVKLELCCGVASLDPEHEALPEPLDLLRRADFALNAARRSGEGAIETWVEGSRGAKREPTRISEIFTGNLARDYRNMALLRDTVNLVAETKDLETLAAQVVERLYSACKADRVGLFRHDEAGAASLVRGVARPTTPVGARRESFSLEKNSLELLDDAMASGEMRSGVVAADSDGKQLAFAVPLIAGDRSLGALYVDGSVESVDIDATDLIFFKALASQLSLALERAQLARAESDRGTVRLEEELMELRTAVKENKLIYRSTAMEQLMATVERVGPTEATILISGDSGTGKELVARKLHELSPRSHKGLTVVDCGAIAPTLIDSELFGHDSGAYTGAQRRRSGRLAEADGGTVLLDEIGELPLEVQSRLLRFVQEKQITRVGDSKPSRVDVRILAATNRDLDEEARAGRFREDLFHRLNVVRINVPALHERPEDILHLAEHFLTQFASQYGKVGARLSDDARDALAAYSWPGNVRELQNRLLQAVILLKDREIDAAALGLPGGAGVSLPRRRTGTPKRRLGSSLDDALKELSEELRRQVESIVNDEQGLQLPLGKWIGEDLLLEADQAEGGIARRAARRLGLAETTYRRRLHQAVELERAGLAPRPDSWRPAQEALTTLLHAMDRQGQPLLQLAEATLLREILNVLPDDDVMGAALLGVTLPTYRRRVRNLEAAASSAVPQESIARS